MAKERTRQQLAAGRGGPWEPRGGAKPRPRVWPRPQTSGPRPGASSGHRQDAGVLRGSLCVAEAPLEPAH